MEKEEKVVVVLLPYFGNLIYLRRQRRITLTSPHLFWVHTASHVSHTMVTSFLGLLSYAIT